MKLDVIIAVLTAQGQPAVLPQDVQGIEHPMATAKSSTSTDADELRPTGRIEAGATSASVTTPQEARAIRRSHVARAS